MNRDNNSLDVFDSPLPFIRYLLPAGFEISKPTRQDYRLRTPRQCLKKDPNHMACESEEFSYFKLKGLILRLRRPRFAVRLGQAETIAQRSAADFLMCRL